MKGKKEKKKNRGRKDRNTNVESAPPPNFIAHSKLAILKY